ncbi:uncharacterized protein [Nicotiana sylvestris]|uniref:uncharacterized protein n=1 Tax=Nicotiana sylvestris TaxID=4096 RepID=UPI00388C77F0
MSKPDYFASPTNSSCCKLLNPNGSCLIAQTTDQGKINAVSVYSRMQSLTDLESIVPFRFSLRMLSIPLHSDCPYINNQGDRIHATIGKYVLKFFRNKIHDLRLYRMNYFVVGPNNLKLRTTTHKLKLTFTQKTFVEETNDHSFHMNIFNLRPFHQLTNEHDVDETELLDVVDQVVTYEDVKTYNQGDDQSFLINVVLEDDQIMATLWSELVDQIQHHLNESADEPLIESSYWIAAKLVNLELDRGWSYLACNKCSRKVEKVGNKYFCAKCNEEESSVTHRYRLQTSLADADCSYPSEMDDILYKKFMFKVIVKQENIESQVEVYKVLKFTDDDDLLKEYDHTLFEDNMNDSHFLDGQSSSGDKLFGDLMAESQLKYVLQTPIEKSVSESGSSVLDDGDACNVKISPLKTYDKKTRYANKASAVAADDDFNSQLSSNKVRRVVKKEKNP